MVAEEKPRSLYNKPYVKRASFNLRDTSTFPLLAIVGRPNVGKSTLFNRIVGSRRAIVGDEPGITRDRLYGQSEWRGRHFRVVDTGGILPDDKDFIPSEIFRQAQVALEEATAILLVVDGRSELAAPDMELARLLRRGGKPLFLAVNKVDTAKQEDLPQDFYRLGIKNIFPVSAEHGRGLDDLLDALLKLFPEPSGEAAQSGSEANNGSPSGEETSQEDRSRRRRKRRAQQSEISNLDIKTIRAEGLADEGLIAKNNPDKDLTSKKLSNQDLTEQDLAEEALAEQALDEEAALPESTPREIKVAIIGHPNVGKSTLLNQLTGADRAIVSPIPGTTRDAVDELLERDGKQFRFIDTAGIRRKGKTELMAEKLSVVMARKHLEAADIALLVIDATEGVSQLDAAIAGYAHESGRSVIIIVNKWDLVISGEKKAVSQSKAARMRESKRPADREAYEQRLRYGLKFLSYAPVLFVSAATGKGTEKIFPVLAQVATERRKRVTTGEMNRFLKHVDFDRASVPVRSRVRIYYMTQSAVAPPTFILFTNRAVKLHFSYQRFLENQIRAAFGFLGTPIWIKNRAH